MIESNLLCPCCQHPYPEHNRFCPTCGVALRDLICLHCSTPNALVALQCQECHRPLPFAIWIGRFQTPTPDGQPRFALVRQVMANEAWVKDLNPGNALPAGKAGLAYTQVAGINGIPQVIWSSDDAVVVAAPVNASGRMLPNLPEAWLDAPSQTRFTWLLAWLRLFERLPERLRASALDPTRLHADFGDTLWTRYLEEGPPPSLRDLGKAWLQFCGEPNIGSQVSNIAKAMARGTVRDVASVRNYLQKHIVWSPIRLHHYGQTDIGRRRQGNEDNFLSYSMTMAEFEPQSDGVGTKGLFVVCDGMGGHQAGADASRLAIQSVRREILPYLADGQLTTGDLASKITEALCGPTNDAIWTINRANGAGDSGMGTTLVMLLICNRWAIHAHVGDSRLYATDGQCLRRLTDDHNQAMSYFRRGEFKTCEEADEYSRTPAGKALTQALGPRPGDQVDPDVSAFEITVPTVFLLCSDGLTDFVSEETIHDLLRKVLAKPDANALKLATFELIRQANQGGGRDNITAVLVYARPSPPVFA